MSLSRPYLGVHYPTDVLAGDKVLVQARRGLIIDRNGEPLAGE